MRGSINSQLGYIWKKIDGIGQSKKESRDSSNKKNITGNKPVSHLVHSYKYKDAIFKTGRQLGEFAKKNFGIKNFEKIDGKIVESFIEHKISENISKKTLDNYISHLSKIQFGLEKIAVENGRTYTAFKQEDLYSAKEIIKDLATPNQYINRAYNNPNALISNLSEKEFLVAKLQLDYGLRIAEASHIREEQLNGNTLTFQGKGGYFLEKKLDPELVEKLRENMENGVFKVNQNYFRDCLKDACEIEGEEYFGAHGLRYNFAQNTFLKAFEENLENGLNPYEAEREALKATSEEMGHHREEITKHYLG